MENKFLTEQAIRKWKPVIDHKDMAPIADAHRRATLATLLENQEKAMAEEARTLNEAAPTNSGGGLGSGTAIGSYDPILISLVRRALPNLIAYDVCGVQPMTGPTGLIFAMRAKYAAQGTPGSYDANEAFFNEANTVFTGVTSASANSNDSNPVYGIANNTVANDATNNNPVQYMGTAAGNTTTTFFPLIIVRQK